MVYPDRVHQFSPKLNKKRGGEVYTIEEELHLAGGQYEGLLRHDNIVNSTVKVFTGPQFKGEEISTWTLSTLTETPWRRIIKVFASVPNVYVTYETPGDTVDADDVNVLQEAITATQTEVERYKSIGIIDGGQFYEEE